MTAIEFLQNFTDNPNDDTVYEAMREFAKHHLKAALESVKNQLFLNDPYFFSETHEKIIDESYSENLIL